MISLALFFLAALGLSFIVGFSKISLPVRILLGGRPAQIIPAYDGGPFASGQASTTAELKPLVPWVGPALVALIECPGCFGFWCGVAGFFFRGSLLLPLDAPFWPGILIFGCATAATNMIGARVMGLLE